MGFVGWGVVGGMGSVSKVPADAAGSVGSVITIRPHSPGKTTIPGKTAPFASRSVRVF